MYLSTAGGFFPDFLFWIKKTVEGKTHQYLTFIDPHGLRNEDYGFRGDRIRLYEFLKEFEKEHVTMDSLRLNSFILSPTPLATTTVNAWEKFADDEEMKKVCKEHHIIEMSQPGDSVPLAYVRQIVNQILS